MKFSQFMMINEVSTLNTIQKGATFSGLLGTNIHDDEINFLKKQGYVHPQVVGKLDKEHTILHKVSKKGTEHFMVRNNNTNNIVSVLEGERNAANTFKINTLESDGTGPKAHDLYHHLLKNGHVGAFMTTSQSEGGRRVWQKLAKKSGISIHGWDNEGDKPVGVDMENPLETHANMGDMIQQRNKIMAATGDEERARKAMMGRAKVEDMPLVASYLSRAREKELLAKMKGNK